VLMLGEVVVAAIRDTFELGEALLAREGKRVLDVAAPAGILGVVRELVALVVADAEVLAGEPEVLPPAEAGVAPVLVPEVGLVGVDEELELHLLELARAEDEVARRHFIPEAPPYLADAERDLDARRVDHVLEVEEHALRRLRAEVGLGLLVADGADPGLEHQVELPRLGQIPAAFGTRIAARGRPETPCLIGGEADLRERGGEVAHQGEAGSELLAVLVRPALQIGGREERLDPRALLQQVRNVVGAKEPLALAARLHRIGEPADVAARLPDL